MLRKLITTNYPSKIPRPSIRHHRFEKYIGRTLTSHEKALISYLEKQKSYRPRPTIVIDSPGHDSSALLLEYLRFRLFNSSQNAHAVVYNPNSPRIDCLKHPRIRYLTYRQPDRIRGSTPTFMLLLNAHDAKTFSPLARPADNFRRLCSALFPILDSSGFLIFHLILPASSSFTHNPNLSTFFSSLHSDSSCVKTDNPTIVVTIANIHDIIGVVTSVLGMTVLPNPPVQLMR